jgi:opacity protein-like surface antigen
MKTSKIYVAVLTVMFLAAFTATSLAKGLVGTDYVMGTFAVIDFDEDALDTGYGIIPSINLNLAEQLDAHLSLGYIWTDGKVGSVNIDAEVLSVDAKLIYFLRPAENITPYIGGGVVAEREKVKFSGYISDEDEDNVGVTGTGGVEIALEDDFLLDASIDYEYIDSDSETGITGQIGYWLTEEVLCAVGVSYSFDEKNTAGLISAVYSF